MSRKQLVWLFLVLGCTPARTPAEEKARQECLALAEVHSNIRADLECHAKELDWDTCPSRPDIMAELAEKQEKCR